MSTEIDLLAKLLVSSLDLYLNRDDTDPNMLLWAAILEQQARARQLLAYMEKHGA
jgi:hypothetical protein